MLCTGVRGGEGGEGVADAQAMSEHGDHDFMACSLQLAELSNSVPSAKRSLAALRPQDTH